jgi:hypothetical protein
MFKYLWTSIQCTEIKIYEDGAPHTSFLLLSQITAIGRSSFRLPSILLYITAIFRIFWNIRNKKYVGIDI